MKAKTEELLYILLWTCDILFLRRVLQLRGFGYLQRSVWVTPGPVEEMRALLATGPVNVKNLILMAARPCAGESDADIVAGAWDFCQINRTYAKHREILARRPCRSIRTQTEARAFQRWLYRERVAWAEAMARDPLLPEVLLPSAYMGRKAWDHRKAVMAKAADQVRAFKPS
jgi:DNA-binding transcriptional regulator PaaX